MTFSIPPHGSRIHVFSVGEGAIKLAHQTYLSRLTEAPADATPVTEAVGAPVDTTYAEVFAIADLAPMGLRAYLAQAHDIPEAHLAADAAKLDHLSGDVLVLAPKALGDLTELHPRPELTFIGSYSPAETDDTRRELPPARATTAEPAIPAPGAAPTGNRQTRLIVVAGLAAAALLLVWLL